MLTIWDLALRALDRFPHRVSRASRASNFETQFSNFKRIIVAALALALALRLPASADSVDGVRPALDNPIAPRGSVMMVPLVADRPGDNWPRMLEVRLEDGTRLRADVVWVHPTPQARVPARGWTDDPRRLSIRGIDRFDDTSRPVDFAAGLGPYLLLRVPEEGEGTMRVNGVVIHPIWVGVPWVDPLRDADAEPLGGAMQMRESPDRPDAHSPFEYWRWVLLADRLNLAAPTPAGDDIQQLAAEHYAALWRIGLGRLAKTSRRIALECREALTHTALDRGKPVAAWVADPQQAASLLSRLLDFSRGDDAALTGAVAWLDEQTPLMLWPENESGNVVRLAIAATRSGAMPVRFAWVGGGQPPSAVQLEGGVIAHVRVDRLPLQASVQLGATKLVEPATQVLRVTSDVGGAAVERSFDIACGPRVIEARPPGVFFPPLTPPLTLADVQLNVARPIDPDRVTLAHVRRLGGRWEVFFECRRIAEMQQSVDPSSIRTYEDLREIEAVTVLLGPDDEDGGPTVWLTIPEHDWPIVVRGLSHPDLQVHKRSFADRWTCRIVLPNQWFSAAETNPALIGFIRSHGDSPQVETGPAPSPPWRISPGRAALDLEHWDDLPTAEQ